MITNSVRHARAENLWIGLAHDSGGVTLTARDDGKGVREVELGNGLTGMNERLHHLGGTLDVQSTPGAGFRLTAWVPIDSMN
jgi:signal transduction histidine kinase